MMKSFGCDQLNEGILGEVMFVPDTGCLKFPDSLFDQNMQFSIIFGVLIWLFWCIVSVVVSSP